MNGTLIQTPLFAAEFRRLRLGDEDLRSLELAVMQHPLAGRVISGSGGIRKLGFAPRSRNTGKSGAFRVCYVWFEDFATVLFLLIYARNQQENLTPDDLRVLRSLMERFKATLKR